MQSLCEYFKHFAIAVAIKQKFTVTVTESKGRHPTVTESKGRHPEVTWLYNVEEGYEKALHMSAIHRIACSDFESYQSESKCFQKSGQSFKFRNFMNALMIFAKYIIVH